MIRAVNLLLIIALFIGVLILSFQRRDYTVVKYLKMKETAILFSYNTISIKQIDSLSSNSNLKFSKLITEKTKIH
jgi:hypothetical protein